MNHSLHLLFCSSFTNIFPFAPYPQSLSRRPTTSPRFAPSIICSTPPTSSQSEKTDPPSFPESAPLSPKRSFSGFPLPVENAIIINAVPIFWASYGPAVKFLNTYVGDVPVLFLNLTCYIFAQASMTLARFVFKDNTPLPIRAGTELGFYLFAGSVLNLAALSYTTVPRAGFLVQLTTAIVPLLSFIRGEYISKAVLRTCLLAIAGAFVLAGEGMSISLNLGDGLALIAAVWYSLHAIRINDVARDVSTLALVDAKTRTELVLAVLCFAIFPHGAWEFSTHLSGKGIAVFAAISAWVGSFAASAATCMQVVGQRRVGANRAAVFYASQPVWTVIIALALRIDSITAREIIGGGMIVSAGILLSLTSNDETA